MRPRRPTLLVFLCAVLLISLIALRMFRAPSGTEGNFMPNVTASFVLTSTAFANGNAIPRAHTCDGDDRSPALAWSGAPAATQSFALIADDPDAPGGTWTHWIVWNIPGKATLLPGDVPKIDSLDNLARQGPNDFRRIGYGGPCPPPGKPHRYYFKLYALDARLDLKPGSSRADLERAMESHILAQAQWMGTYQR